MPNLELSTIVHPKEGDLAVPRVKLRKFNQVTIPKKIGEKVGVEEGDYLEVEVHEKGILFKPLKAIFIDKKQLTKEQVLELVRQGEITTGRGAELLGMKYQDFLDLMYKEGIPLLRYSKEIREAEDKNREKLFPRGKA